MSNIRITGLPLAVQSASGSEIVSIVQPGNATGTTSQATITDIRPPVNNRIPVTTDTAGTFHLSLTGNFNNAGTIASPWGPNIQSAMQIISQRYDFHGTGCTFSLANGTYANNNGGTDNWGNLQAIGCKFVMVTSDSQSATTVTVDAQQLISYQQVPYLEFRDITIKGSFVCENGLAKIHNCNWTQFDDSGPFIGFCGPFADFGQIVWTGVSTINGSAHFTITAIGGIMQVLATSIVASGGIVQPRSADRGFVSSTDQGEVYISPSTIWGTASGGSWVGKRFRLLSGATINASGNGFAAIPGTIDGTITTGCKYVG